MASLHVDLTIADDVGDGSSELDFLAGLRVSYPDIARIYVKSKRETATERAMEKAALFQFLLKPVDPAQLGLVVERALGGARSRARWGNYPLASIH